MELKSSQLLRTCQWTLQEIGEISKNIVNAFRVVGEFAWSKLFCYIRSSFKESLGNWGQRLWGQLTRRINHRWVMGYSFFLYGVYDEGQKCYPRFQNFISHQQPAFVKGTLYKLACGLALLNPQGDKVVPGRLVELNVSENHWPIIDAINGYNAAAGKKNFIVREQVEVSLHESAPVMAQTYCLSLDKKIRGCQEITDESFYTQIQSHQTLLDRLTERQKTYIQKLSQAKGREIVPVDMALYRELMSLELIVDKGRRLALTSLGQEVSLFL